MNEETAAATAGGGRLGTIVGAIAAPTSLITALLYYFGYYHAYWFFAYFGVNSTVLGFGTADYLMRSLDALWVPMTVTAAAGLLALRGHEVLRGRLAAGAWTRILRQAVPVALGLGFLLALGGLWSTFTQTFLNRVLVLAPLSLSIGVMLLAYALHLRRAVLPTAPAAANPATAPADPGADTHPDPDGAPPADTGEPDPPDDTHGTHGTHDTQDTQDTHDIGSSASPPRPEWAALTEWAVVLVLVGLGLVWAANDYAASVGETRARRFAADLEDYPSAVLYSERSLSISAPGVRETRCRDDKAAYGYRYDGLTLVMESGHQYVLLPYRWSSTDGVALVIPQSDSVRIEFGPAPRTRVAAAPPPTC